MIQNSTILQKKIPSILMICVGFFVLIVSFAQAQESLFLGASQTAREVRQESLQKHVDRTRKSKERKQQSLLLLHDDLQSREWSKRFSAGELKNIAVATKVFRANEKKLLDLYDKRIALLEQGIAALAQESFTEDRVGVDEMMYITDIYRAQDRVYNAFLEASRSRQ